VTTMTFPSAHCLTCTYAAEAELLCITAAAQLGRRQAYLKTGDSALVTEVCQDLLVGIQHLLVGGYGCDFKISYADGMLLRKNT